MPGAGELWVGASCWGGTGVLPSAGSGPVKGQVEPLGRRRWGLGGPVWCHRVLGGGEVPQPPWICRVEVLRRVR